MSGKGGSGKKERPDGTVTVRLRLTVSPGARRSEIAGRLADGRIKVRVAAAAESGRANRELVRFLARELAVPSSAVKLVAGQAARHKVVEVTAPEERVRKWTEAPSATNGDRNRA